MFFLLNRGGRGRADKSRSPKRMEWRSCGRHCKGVFDAVVVITDARTIWGGGAQGADTLELAKQCLCERVATGASSSAARPASLAWRPTRRSPRTCVVTKSFPGLRAAQARQQRGPSVRYGTSSLPRRACFGGTAPQASTAAAVATPRLSMGPARSRLERRRRPTRAP